MQKAATATAKKLQDTDTKYRNILNKIGGEILGKIPLDGMGRHVP